MENEVYLKLIETSSADLKRNYVPAYYFDIYLTKNDIKVGTCDLRVGYNNNTFLGGNIGYEIDPPYRGHYYAAKACLLLLELAKTNQMPYVIITCAPDNIASRKTCEKLGATYLATIPVPAEHELYHAGQTTTCQYKINII